MRRVGVPSQPRSSVAAGGAKRAVRPEGDPDRLSRLRLRDRLGPAPRCLFVGINPGVRSALTGHHFAGYSNRFWRLLVESRLVPEPVTYLDDGRLPEWGLGITNLVARPTPGIDDLRPDEYARGWRVLRRKIATHRPRTVALVGVTVYRAILPLLSGDAASRSSRGPSSRTGSVLGLREETVHGAALFVLPNPSGRNANFSYAEMLEAFASLRRHLSRHAAPRA